MCVSEAQIVFLGPVPARYCKNPEPDWRIKAAAVEGAASQTQVNGVILQNQGQGLLQL